jgi:hypothetical protein
VATHLLAKDGVEIVSSERGLAQVAPPQGNAEVARRPTIAPLPTPPTPRTHRPEVLR